MSNRKIKFEKIWNARDMGGLLNVHGDMISSGLLLRSANLADATEKDKRTLQEQYHIAKIVDLRTEMERKEKPDVFIPNTEYQSIPIFDESMAGISHEKSLNKEQILAVIPKLGFLYGQMVTNESCRQNLGMAARSVMEHDFSKGSVLWHCTEGKDRCGLLSATILFLLDVSEDDVMEDYLKTNKAAITRVEKLKKKLHLAGLHREKIEKIEGYFVAKEEFLNAALKTMKEEYGSINQFMIKGLNISMQQKEDFKQKVLE